MNEKELEFLLKQGEGLKLEFKEKYSSRIDEDIVAFANSKGGVLILGVSDEGKIIGQELTNEIKAQINTLARNCSPSIEVKISSINKLVVIEIFEGKEKPYSCSSGYYRRLDGNTQKKVSKFIPQSKLTLLRFKGDTKADILDRMEVQDDLLTQFEQAIFFLKKHLNLKSTIKGTERKEEYDVPVEVWREAIANAIIHRDYSITGANISVEIYD